MRVLLILRGAPGCGKSTWIKEQGLEKYTLSSDEIRMMCAAPQLTVDGGVAISQSNDQVVWDTLFRLLRTRMQNGEFTVIDATNSKTSEMNRYKELSDFYRYRMYCVDMTDVPIEVSKERNACREQLKRVPEIAIDKVYSRFETQKIPSGYTVIKPDELEKVFLHKNDLSNFEKVHIFGDIHGCYSALKEYVDRYITNPGNEFFIFTGDYIDRGIENAEVVRLLCKIADQKNVLLLEGNHERWLWTWAHDGTCESKEFELRTRAELEDAKIDKKDVRRMYRRMGQCAWFDYHGKEFFVTHGGLSAMPDYPTFVATHQMIKGVGNYNDFEAVETAWLSNSPDNCYQVHGHRNTKKLPVQVNERNYNLEGHIEFGGELRVIQLLPSGEIVPVEIKNNVFRATEERKRFKGDSESDKSVGDLVINLRQSKLISEKRYGNISSFNFTKTAFFDKAWDDMTTRARGLYINVPREKIVARAYEKFFNINERPETKLEALQYSLAFPVRAYVKENGFLGIVAYNEENDDLLITTKSSPDGEFAQWLRGNMETMLGADKLKVIKEYSKEHNVSFVFECVDMCHDPHIIEYPESKLFLLDIIRNEINFEKLPFEELCKASKDIGIQHKEFAFKLESYSDFFDFYNTVMDPDYLYHGRHVEGFVVEDNNGKMVKLKLTYYNFWKFMRSIAHETLKKGYVDPRRTSALTTPLANHFYGWLKAQYADGNVDSLPKDICSLRTMFFASETGKAFVADQ